MLLPFTIILILWKWPLPQYRWQQPFLFHHPYFLIGDKTGNRRVPGIDKQGWCGQPGDNISPGWSQSISTSVTNHGPCCLCHMTLLKDYYRVDMSMCRYIMSCFMKWVTMFGNFMLVFLRCAFSLFSSVAFLLRSFSFPSVFLIGISDQIRSVVSFGGRGARLWRHPG